MTILTWLILAGVAGIIVYALYAPGRPALAIALLLGGASLLVGGLTGFLFGIPRSLQGQPPATPGAAASAARGPATPQEIYGANTNLEQISDWLTKILVGVGLTQMPAIRDGIRGLANFMGAAIGGVGGPQAALAVMLYFLACGFLYGFLWSRLFLLGEFARADLDARQQRVEAGERKGQIDAQALRWTSEFLAEDGDGAKFSVDELKETIKQASIQVRTTIFYNAWKVRSESWRHPSTKPRMERTIPIFEALVEGDPQEIYHTNRAQLAFALKDKVRASDDDLRRAIDLLTKAIEIRQRRKEEGDWVVYEFNRAICRIMLDADYRGQRASAAAVRAEIVADLKAAAKAADLRARISTGSPCSEWIQLNQVTDDELGI